MYKSFLKNYMQGKNLVVKMSVLHKYQTLTWWMDLDIGPQIADITNSSLLYTSTIFQGLYCFGFTLNL